MAEMALMSVSDDFSTGYEEAVEQGV